MTQLIAGYEVTRFGVPMIGQYVNTGRGRTVTISPAVPGAQYRITAWALGDGRRSATPAVVDATTTREAGQSEKHLCISTVTYVRTYASDTSPQHNSIAKLMSPQQSLLQ